MGDRGRAADVVWSAGVGLLMTAKAASLGARGFYSTLALGAQEEVLAAIDMKIREARNAPYGPELGRQMYIAGFQSLRDWIAQWKPPT